MNTRPKWIVWRSVNSPPQQRIQLRVFDSPSRSLVPILTELSLLRTYSRKDRRDTGALHQSRTASVHKLCKYYTVFKRVRKLRKASTAFVMSVRLFARNSALTGRILMKIDI